MVASGTFWLNLLVLLTIVVGKDIYVSGLERNFNFRPPHILQEVMQRLDNLTKLVFTHRILQLEVGNHLETRMTNFLTSRLSLKASGKRAVADSNTSDNHSGSNKVGFVPVETEVEMTTRTARNNMGPGRMKQGTLI